MEKQADLLVSSLRVIAQTNGLLATIRASASRKRTPARRIGVASYVAGDYRV